MMLAIGERYRSFLEKSLIYHGFEPLWMPDNPLLDPRLAAHADLDLSVLEQRIVVSKGVNPGIVNFLTNRGCDIKFVRMEEGAVYPKDAGLCVCDTGKYLIANPKTADPAVLELFSQRKLISVKQGYARCSVCVADEESIITSDEGIADKARAAGLDVLKICSGHIDLPGYSEGFIGGASIRLTPKMIAFTGSLHKHPDGSAILDFLNKKGLEVVFLTERVLLDVGGGITLP